MAMRTSGILTIGGAFVAILGGAFALLMLRAFFVDKGQGFVDLSGLVVGGVVAAVGLALVAAGRDRGGGETKRDAPGTYLGAHGLAWEKKKEIAAGPDSQEKRARCPH